MFSCQLLENIFLSKNILGVTPLLVAVRRKHAQVVTILLENGADVNARHCCGE